LICNYPSRLGHTVSRHNQGSIFYHLGDLLSENNARTVSKPPAEARIAMGGVALKPRGLCFNIQRGNSMRKVIRGYAKDKNLNLILIGTIPVPHSKDKCSPAARQAKRYLVRQGATIFKKETIR
jgi:hypothetical protein